VGHDLGHIQGLQHINNPINLKCGNTGVSWFGQRSVLEHDYKILTDVQINMALKIQRSSLSLAGVFVGVQIVGIVFYLSLPKGSRLAPLVPAPMTLYINLDRKSTSA
jgi:hypothetical protein